MWSLLWIALIIIVFVILFFRYPRLKNDISIKKMPILVTGAASGVGKALCRKLISQGSFVIATDINFTQLEQIYTDYDRRSVIAIFMDVTKTETVQQAVKQVEQEIIKGYKEGYIASEGLFALVNCAGVLYNRLTGLLEQSDEEMEKMFAVNVFGVHKCTKAFYPLIKKHKQQPVIIFIASLTAFLAQPFTGFYAATKSSIRGYADTLRREFLANNKIRVSCISPGVIATAMIVENHPGINYNSEFSHVMESFFGTDPRQRLIDLGRLQKPESVADIVIGCISSSNAPAHIIVDNFLERVLFFVLYAFGTKPYDLILSYVLKGKSI